MKLVPGAVLGTHAHHPASLHSQLSEICDRIHTNCTESMHYVVHVCIDGYVCIYFGWAIACLNEEQWECTLPIFIVCIFSALMTVYCLICRSTLKEERVTN